MTAVFTVRSAILAVFVIMGVLISGNNASKGQTCKGAPKAIATCTKYILKDAPQKYVPGKGPSHACCSAVKAADIPCFCQHVTEKMEEKLDMEKVANVAKECGKPLASGSICGSYTVPPTV